MVLEEMKNVLTTFKSPKLLFITLTQVRKGLFFIKERNDFMEKIRLKDGTEFDLIPMPIEDKGNLRIIKFISDLPHNEILAKFNDANIEKIDYILADNSIGTTYEDCVAFKSLAFVPNVQVDDNNVSDIWVVVLSTDAIERELKRISDVSAITTDALNVLLTDILPIIM